MLRRGAAISDWRQLACAVRWQPGVPAAARGVAYVGLVEADEVRLTQEAEGEVEQLRHDSGEVLRNFTPLPELLPLHFPS